MNKIIIFMALGTGRCAEKAGSYVFNNAAELEEFLKNDNSMRYVASYDTTSHQAKKNAWAMAYASGETKADCPMRTDADRELLKYVPSLIKKYNK